MRRASFLCAAAACACLHWGAATAATLSKPAHPAPAAARRFVDQTAAAGNAFASPEGPRRLVARADVFTRLGELGEDVPGGPTLASFLIACFLAFWQLLGVRD